MDIMEDLYTTTFSNNEAFFKKAAAEIESLRAQVAKLTCQRDEAVQMLADWCDAVHNNGTSWDDWDEHYKDAAWRQCGIRELIDAARTAEGEIK